MLLTDYTKGHQNNQILPYTTSCMHACIYVLAHSLFILGLK